MHLVTHRFIFSLIHSFFVFSTPHSLCYVVLCNNRVVHLSEACRRMETVNEQVMPFAHAYISKEKKDREKNAELVEEEQRDEDGNVITVRKNLATPITTAKKKLAESAAMGSSGGGPEENSKLAASNSLLRNLNPHGLVPPGR